MPARLPAIQTLTDEKACIYSRAGELLWFSPAWFDNGVGPANGRDILGRMWQEHIHVDDAEATMRWFADNEESAHAFRFTLTSSKKKVVVVYYKLHYGRDWLVLGEILHAGNVHELLQVDATMLEHLETE